MNDNSIISILHISDMHYTKRKIHDQKLIIDALSTDLSAICIGHRRPDLIIFTGDLVQAGGVDHHEEAYDAVLSEVIKATGCSDERLFIVPGNHDLSRTVVNKNVDDHTTWRKAADNPDEMNRLYATDSFSSVNKLKFAPFFELQKYLTDDALRHRNDFATVHHISVLNIDIVIINTAVLSVGGIDGFGGDETLLAVPEHALLDAAKHLTDGSYRIYCTHHPSSVLSPSASRILANSIESHSHLHLYGHMHDPQPKNITGLRGELFTDQAGALFTHRQKAYIGYSLISLDRNSMHCEVLLRSYFDERKVFDEALDIVEGGRFYSSPSARQFWRTIAKPVDESILRGYLSPEQLNIFKDELFLDEYDREAHERFVPPPMKRLHVRSSHSDQTKSVSDENVTFDLLLKDSMNVILYAPAEYGRTTVLKELALQHFTLSQAEILPRIPVIVDFGDIKHNTTSILRSLRGKISILPPGLDFDSLLRLGYLCLMFDDVIFSDARRMSILRDFVSNYPKPRYILSTLKSAMTQFGSRVKPEMPIHFDVIEICVLRRKDMRLLVHAYSNGADVDTMLDRLQSEFKEINIPFTAANGSILMSIYEVHSKFSPINRSVLIEQFVDTTLRKTAAEQSRRETFDYANKTALLAHVAAWMVRENEYIPSGEEVRSVIKEYINRLGLNADINNLLTEFMTARIFVQRSEGRIGFRYRAVLEYFIAFQMVVDHAFRAWVLADERYLQFANEIQYYAGKVRNDVGLVNEISIRFQILEQEHETTFGEFDLGQISTLQLPNKNTDVTDDILSKQLSAPLSQEEKDSELEAELPVDLENRQEVFRPTITNPAHKWLLGLTLYSGIVKNMELIDDTEKRRHLSNLWRAWSISISLSLRIVPELARHRQFRINGVLYEMNAPHSMTDGELTRIISLHMPVAVSKMLSASLGTEKLEKQLVEPELDTVNRPLVYEFLRSCLIADLKLSATPSALKTALSALQSSPYLRESLVWKIAELRRLDRISEEHMNAIASTLAGAMADLKGISKGRKSEEKSKLLKALKTETIVLRMKRLHDNES